MPYSISRWLIRCLNNYDKVLMAFVLLGSCFISALAQTPTETETPTETAEPPSTESTTTPTEPPLYPSREIRDKTLIAEAMEDESKWLETTYGKILVLYRPTEAKVTNGVLVLFHAAETPQSWPPVLENLRRNLPRYGWETLAVTMPQAEPKPIPDRDKLKGDNSQTDEENKTETISSASSSTASSSASLVSREELIREYIKVSIEFLHSNGQFNAVMLFDNSTVTLGMQALSVEIKENPEDPKTVDGPLQALILLNLQSQEALTKAQLNEVLHKKQLPVMDIFFAPDSEQQKQQRELHRAVAMRNKLDNYQPFLTELPAKTMEDDHSSFVVGRVRGFMKAVATGSEIKAESIKVK